ncbi:MAG: c-type cytochrome biogenesis protein CcsB [Gammaproteobacteria bacterium]|nr:c-type cytochrome biogenesis protein CcsB [Gammaproteobacteria bacterium]
MSITEQDLLNKLEGDSKFNFKLVGWLALVAIAVGLVFWQYGAKFDVYETAILVGTGVGVAWIGAVWPAMGRYIVAVALISLAAINIYDGSLANGETKFFLKYLISSQSAVMWMSALFVMSIVAYGVGYVSSFTQKVGSALVWAGAGAGLVGLMVRWHESYLIHPDVGYIPVSNLYEVFILFAVITSILYLFYERRYQNRNLGFFVMLVVGAAIGFLLWYHFSRGASEIRPLVPALQSYWMKIHVPANFVGYGAFALAAMVGVAYLIFDGSKRAIAQKFDMQMLDDLMYRSIALGFAFFTLATILGALWAAEAWGGYWSWDPKETWALIVWLNYAAWLHLRLTKGWRGSVMAWWSIIGLFVTLFAFLGVNMFLSGLHSYGSL